MANSLEKISRGLDAASAEAGGRGARRPGDSRETVVRLAGRAHVHHDDVQQARLRLENIEDHVRDIIRSAGVARADEAREIHERWMSETELDLGVRTRLSRKYVDQSDAAYAAAMAAMLQPLVADCRTLYGVIEGQAPLHASRAQQLQIYALGTPERASLEATAAKSGAVGLLSMAQQADSLMRSGEKADVHLGKMMAAAVVLEAGARGRGDVLFDRGALIGAAPMHEHDVVAGAIEAGRSAMSHIEAMVQGATTGRLDDSARISRALDVRDGAGPAPAEED